MRAVASHERGIEFCGLTGEFGEQRVHVDQWRSTGGSGGGARPRELVLVALGACVGMVVVEKSAEKGIDIGHMDVTAEDITFDPQRFTDLRVTVRTVNPLSPADADYLRHEIWADSPVLLALADSSQVELVFGSSAPDL